MLILSPKQTPLTQDLPAQQDWQGHALEKVKREQGWVEVTAAADELSSPQLGPPKGGKRTGRVLEKKMLSVSHSGHETQMNISFSFPPAPTHLLKALVTVQATLATAKWRLATSYSHTGSFSNQSAFWQKDRTVLSPFPSPSSSY